MAKRGVGGLNNVDILRVSLEGNSSVSPRDISNKVAMSPYSIPQSSGVVSVTVEQVVNQK